MSTYTDLKNRVKETITVGFRPEDRVTTQKVRFYNEENEYWGSFSGSLSGKINIFGGKLSSVDVYNATLVNPAVKTSTGFIIDLGSMADQLEELSVYAYEDLSNAISSCIDDILNISGAISAVPGDTADQLSGLSSMFWELRSALDDEASTRISSDERIEGDFTRRIIELAMRAAAADKRLHDNIVVLSAGLDDEISARIQADDAVSASLMSYADNRRHYEIYSMDTAPQMPIKAKEFAVNKLVNYDLPNGFVVDDRNQLVGYVEEYNTATGDCRFTAYSDANYSVANESGVAVKEFPYTQILGLNSYNFDSGTQTRQCPDAVHELVYTRAANPGNFEQNQFDIRVMMPNMRAVKHNGRTIGFVYGAGAGSSVSAGTLQFIPSELIGDPNLSSFAKDVQVPFSIAVNGGKISDDALYPNCDLQIISAAPMFHYRAQISSWPLALLTGEGFESCDARVYRDLWTKEEGKPVRQFAVSMVAKHDPAAGQQDFYLTAPDFESILREYDDKSFDLLKYDNINKVISYTNEKKYLSCLVRIIERDKQFDLPLSSLDANTELISASSAAISFAPLSSAVNDAISSLVVAGPYILNRDNGMLSCEVTTRISEGEAGSDVVIRVYDTGKIFVKFRAPDGNTVIFGDNDYVDFEQRGVYDDQSTDYGRCGFDADNIDFTQDPPDERCAEEGSFWIGSAAGEGDEYTGLQFRREYQKTGRESYGVNDIVIEIPDKAEGSIESREFLFVIRPQGSGLLGQKATIKFVTPRGEPIEFFAEHLPEFRIDCGKYITFRLQEITYGKFELLDWDQSMQESRLDYLEATLSSEISNRISSVSDLSVKLSGEIDNLSVALSAEIDSLSAALSGEIDSLSAALSVEVDSLSTALSGEIDNLSAALSGEIDNLSVALSGEIDSLSTALSGEIDSLSVALSGEIDDLSAALSTEISANRVEISRNRKDIDFLLFVERKSMIYLGTLLSVDTHKDRDLSCYFENALGFHHAPDFLFKQGFTFKLSAEQTDLFGIDGETISFFPNDVIIFNSSVMLSAVCAKNLDILNDYGTEINDISTALSNAIGNLSAALSGEIDDLSAALSGEIDNLSAALSSEIGNLSIALSGEIDNLSVALSSEIDSLSTALSGEIDDLSAALSGEIDNLSAALSGEIDNLSAALSGEIDNLSVALSGEIDSLSTALSGEIDSLSIALSGEIDDLSAEITGTISAVSSDLSAAVDAKFTLSADFSELSGDFYELSGFIGRTLLSTDAARPGIVNLQDEFHYGGEHDYRNYTMHMISGTIKLKLV